MHLICRMHQGNKEGNSNIFSGATFYSGFSVYTNAQNDANKSNWRIKDTAIVLGLSFAPELVSMSCFPDNTPSSPSRRMSSIKSDLLASVWTTWLRLKGLTSLSWTSNRSLASMLHNALLASKSSEVKGNRSRRDCKKTKSACTNYGLMCDRSHTIVPSKPKILPKLAEQDFRPLSLYFMNMPAYCPNY